MISNAPKPYQMLSIPTRKELMQAVSMWREVSMTLAAKCDQIEQRLDAANIPKLQHQSPSGLVLPNQN